MRLLSVEDLSFVEFGASKWHIPHYAIFSHTWSMGEVTFLDILEGTGRHKHGWSKVVLCREQAEKDGFGYFWIDACCIDKSNSVELTEAINSMYDWFAHASVCYVYLQDVSKQDSDEKSNTSQYTWQSSFRKARWFTRGWTLQELIAPPTVVFYSSEWTRLGDKQALQHMIHGITNIPTEVLDGTKQCNAYSISERMRWASCRMTSRIEDQAYCLMGLFDVNMPLIYGEGHRAFQRLQKEIMSLADQISGLRLLTVETTPLAIETFGTLEQPKYAIFSHTWSKEEVSYQDILLGRAPTRMGYYKIKKACEEAASRGLKYLWVDTCCIDKKSSAELQEAICSMYKWYKNAQICYVYLEDYDISSTPAPQLSACRWFKRGWTLQELIAPSSLEFFDSKWQKLGTKTTLRQQIAGITRIDLKVLDGESPEKRTIAERMSWASERSTSRVEDIAYSLMGIFDVYLPMLYGEGDRAFIRLQEEIMKRSEDYTIFAWKSAGPGSSSRGFFAQSPSEFADRLRTGDRIPPSLQVLSQYKALDHHLYNPIALTSRGLLITLPLLRKDALKSELPGTTLFRATNVAPFARLFRRPELQAVTYLALICRINLKKAQEDQILCIWLRKHPECGMFTRTSPETMTILPGKRGSDFKMHTIYARPFGNVEDD